MTSLKIALIGMSAKPFHAGHAGLIRIASQNQDVVQVYASLTPRGSETEREFVILPDKMKQVWDELILAKLPQNVEVVFSNNPISSIYEELENCIEDAEYHIYAGNDACEKSFANVQKYTNLKIDENLFIHEITRETLSEASGTECRKALFRNDYKTFAKLMPWFVDSQRAWEILRS